jgi:hypothetical protein
MVGPVKYVTEEFLDFAEFTLGSKTTLLGVSQVLCWWLPVPYIGS